MKIPVLCCKRSHMELRISHFGVSQMPPSLLRTFCYYISRPCPTRVSYCGQLRTPSTDVTTYGRPHGILTNWLGAVIYPPRALSSLEVAVKTLWKKYAHFCRYRKGEWESVRLNINADRIERRVRTKTRE